MQAMAAKFLEHGLISKEDISRFEIKRFDELTANNIWKSGRHYEETGIVVDPQVLYHSKYQCQAAWFIGVDFIEDECSLRIICKHALESTQLKCSLQHLVGAEDFYWTSVKGIDVFLPGDQRRSRSR